MQVKVIDHPLIQHKLTHIRDVTTGTKEFRELLDEIAMLMTYELTRNLNLEEVEIQTPVAKCKAKVLAGKKMGVIPILRAGLGMVDGIWEMMPSAEVWHIGLYRDVETLQPVSYYNKLPTFPTVQVCLVLDPMLATGGSAIATIDILKKWGAQRIKFVGLLAAPEGIAALHNAHPDVPIHIAQIDSHLNNIGFIVPGLGDAGDRQFGTG